MLRRLCGGIAQKRRVFGDLRYISFSTPALSASVYSPSDVISLSQQYSQLQKNDILKYSSLLTSKETLSCASSPEFLDQVVNSAAVLISQPENAGSVPVLYWLEGFKALGISCNTKPNYRDVISDLVVHLTRTNGAMRVASFPSLVATLNRLKWNWKGLAARSDQQYVQLFAKDVEGLLLSKRATLTDAEEETLLFALSRVSHLGLRWNDLSKSCQELLWAALERASAEASRRDAAKKDKLLHLCVQILCTMHCDLTSIQPRQKQTWLHKALAFTTESREHSLRDDRDKWAFEKPLVAFNLPMAQYAPTTQTALAALYREIVAHLPLADRISFDQRLIQNVPGWSEFAAAHALPEAKKLPPNVTGSAIASEAVSPRFFAVGSASSAANASAAAPSVAALVALLPASASTAQLPSSSPSVARRRSVLVTTVVTSAVERIEHFNEQNEVVRVEEVQKPAVTRTETVTTETVVSTATTATAASEELSQPHTTSVAAVSKHPLQSETPVADTTTTTATAAATAPRSVPDVEFPSHSRVESPAAKTTAAAAKGTSSSVVKTPPPLPPTRTKGTSAAAAVATLNATNAQASETTTAPSVVVATPPTERHWALMSNERRATFLASRSDFSTHRGGKFLTELADSGVTFRALPPVTQAAIMAFLRQEKTCLVNETYFTSIIRAISRLNLGWDDDEIMSRVLEKGIVRFTPVLNANTFTKVLFSLLHMCAPFDQLQPATQDALASAAQRLASDMGIRDMSFVARLLLRFVYAADHSEAAKAAAAAASQERGEEAPTEGSETWLDGGVSAPEAAGGSSARSDDTTIWRFHEAMVTALSALLSSNSSSSSAGSAPIKNVAYNLPLHIARYVDFLSQFPRGKAVLATARCADVLTAIRRGSSKQQAPRVFRDFLDAFQGELVVLSVDSAAAPAGTAGNNEYTVNVATPLGPWQLAGCNRGVYRNGELVAQIMFRSTAEIKDASVHAEYHNEKVLQALTELYHPGLPTFIVEEERLERASRGEDSVEYDSMMADLVAFVRRL